MERRSFDWRVPVIWAVLLTLSLFAHAYVEVANEARRGNAVGLARVLMVEVASQSRGRGPFAGDLLAASPLADRGGAA